MLFTSIRFPQIRVKLSSGRDVTRADGKLWPVSRSQYAEFQMGKFETNDIEVIEALIHHPSYNRDFFGPFSRAEVVSGKYKEDLAKLNKKASIDDTLKPDVDKLAKEAERAALEKKAGVTNRPINDGRESQVGNITTVTPGK